MVFYGLISQILLSICFAIQLPILVIEKETNLEKF